MKCYRACHLRFQNDNTCIRIFVICLDFTFVTIDEQHNMIDPQLFQSPPTVIHVSAKRQHAYSLCVYSNKVTPSRKLFSNALC